MKKTLLLLCIFGSITLFYQCEDKGYVSDNNAKLRLSTDTVFFDTVFSDVGTVTEIITVHNPHNKSILVSEIYLAKGNKSVFRINIDGEPADKVKDKKIGPKDSLFIFIEATIDPNGGNLPLLVNDSIVFITNNNFQDVKLMAWGQDVHYFNNEIIETQTWTNDKPYLIYNNLLVDSFETLTIEAGTIIHLHWLSSIVVYGTLIINGTSEEPVTFLGDRLEEVYEDKPGQWGTIALLGDENEHYIDHVITRNAISGFQIGHPCIDKEVRLKLLNTQILNSLGNGMIVYGAKIQSFNTVVDNSGIRALAILNGGNYEFYHCTFAGNSGSEPGIVMTNYAECQEYYRDSATYSIYDSTYMVYNNLKKALFANSIIHGRDPERGELLVSIDNDYGFEYLFDHCLMTLNTDSFDVTNSQNFNDITLNRDPKFKDLSEKVFELDTLSPAKDAGNFVFINSFTELAKDLNDNDRYHDQKPDLGAFERIEQ